MHNLKDLSENEKVVKTQILSKISRNLTMTIEREMSRMSFF